MGVDGCPPLIQLGRMVDVHRCMSAALQQSTAVPGCWLEATFMQLAVMSACCTLLRYQWRLVDFRLPRKTKTHMCRVTLQICDTKKRVGGAIGRGVLRTKLQKERNSTMCETKRGVTISWGMLQQVLFVVVFFLVFALAHISSSGPCAIPSSYPREPSRS